MTATVQHRQSVLDLAIQHLGSVEACFTVAERLGISITDEPNAGTTFDVSTTEVLDKKITEYYVVNNLVPATGDLSGLMYEGIGYMTIEVDFISG